MFRLGSKGWLIPLILAAAPISRNTDGGDGEPAELVVRGTVIDDETGEAIPAFRLIPASVRDEKRTPTWQSHLMRSFEGGRFAWHRRFWETTRFRAEAEGYRPGISRVVSRSEGRATLDFRLEPDDGLAGRVISTDGEPVEGAAVTLATVSKEVWVRGGQVEVVKHGPRLGAMVVLTDAEGRFRLPPEADPASIVVAHESGHAEVALTDDLGAEPVVRLRPWGHVEGRVLAGAEPIKGRKVHVGCWRPAGSDSPYIHYSDEETTDDSGRFRAGPMPAGSVFVNRWFEVGESSVVPSGTTAWVIVRPGEAAQVVLGGEGWPVVGRLSGPVGAPAIDWSRADLRIAPVAPHIGLPGDDDSWQVYARFLRSEEGHAYSREGLRVGDDGTFRIEGVPQGSYRLSARVDVREPGRLGDAETLRAWGGVGFTIDATAEGGGEEPFDLGTVPLRWRGQDP